MSTTTIYVDAGTGRIINSVNGGRVSENDYPAFFENGNDTLVIRFRKVTNAGTSEAALTPIMLGAAAAYQMSITENSDWSEATAPLIRVNNIANIYVSDEANAEITVEWKNTTQEFRNYIESAASSGTALGGIEAVEITADPTPLNAAIQDIGGIASGAKQLTIVDASTVAAGDRCLINDANLETVIVTGIDFDTNILTFIGNGTGGGTVYSHANAVEVVISSSEEKVLLQDSCNLRNRRDLGGQASTENDPGYYDAPTVDSKLNLKVNKDFSGYGTKAALVDADTLLTNNSENSGSPIVITFTKIWTWIVSKLAAAGYSKTYKASFSKAGVTGTTTKILTFTHNLNEQYSLHVTISNKTSGERIKFDKVTYTDANTITVEVTEAYDDMSATTNDYYIRITT